MKKSVALLAAGLLGLGAVAAPAVFSAPASQAVPDIPFQRFTLPNGLTVGVHEDHKAPVVAVSIWSHVGPGNEPARKTAFAHHFENLMFSGSENHKGTYFTP